MRISIFLYLFTECSGLNHVDKPWLELKLKVVRPEFWSSAKVPILGAENSSKVFLAIASLLVLILLGWVDL
jgi:hypothetical protein